MYLLGKQFIYKLVLFFQAYAQIQREHQISPGDFPNINRMKEQLQHHDFTKFNPIKPKLLDTVDKMLAQDIAKLMLMIPQVSRFCSSFLVQ